MSKQEKIKAYNPDGVGAVNGRLFGLPFDYEESDIILLPVPWEATVSYGAGTARGPQAILEASPQLDLYDTFYPNGWQRGFFMQEISKDWIEKSQSTRKKADTIIQFQEGGGSLKDNHSLQKVLDDVNTASTELNTLVQSEASKILHDNKLCGIVGGDHSTPLGLLQALADRHESFGVLQIDAHADLRDSYEGFEFSHASIMFNALKIPQLSKLVQVGIRDISPGEAGMIENSEGRIKCFYDNDIKSRLYNGHTWLSICEGIIHELPEKVYISFDIDGLDPKLCPGTGTPVPGGLQFEEATYLLQLLADSGKKIIGFDLCEVAPGNTEWNGNVGARVLYKLCLAAAKNS